MLTIIFGRISHLQLQNDVSIGWTTHLDPDSSTRSPHLASLLQCKDLRKGQTPRGQYPKLSSALDTSRGQSGNDSFCSAPVANVSQPRSSRGRRTLLVQGGAAGTPVGLDSGRDVDLDDGHRNSHACRPRRESNIPRDPKCAGAGR